MCSTRYWRPIGRYGRCECADRLPVGIIRCKLGAIASYAKAINWEIQRRRKIILARFLYYLKGHDFFILDEVFVSLDRDYLKNILPVIKSYIKGKTGIVISHNLSVTETLCDNDALKSLLADYLTEE